MEKQIQKLSSYETVGNKVKFTIKTEDLNGISVYDVQMAHGFHPAGYGAAFDKTETNGITTFYCWRSCD
jgi:hypothetical protein